MRKTLLSVTLLALSGATPVFADPKRINGAMCELEMDSQIQYMDRGAIRAGGHQGQTVGLVYPLLRSNTTNTNGLANLVVNVDKSYTTQFTCYGESYDMAGSALKIVSRTTTTTGRIALTWNNSINVSSANGTYGVVCYVVGSNVTDFADEIFAVDYDEP